MKTKILLAAAERLERWAANIRAYVKRQEAKKKAERLEELRRSGKLLTFVWVEFHDGGYPYSYLAERDIFHIGDRVKAPVGNGNHLLHGTVTDVKHLPADEAPYPLDKIKCLTEFAEDRHTEAERKEKHEMMTEVSASFGVKPTIEAEGCQIPFGLFLQEMEKENIDEASFCLTNDFEDIVRYIGCEPCDDAPYWAGKCDIQHGCAFSSARELLEAKIYYGQSLEEIWESVWFMEIEGQDAKSWLRFQKEDEKTSILNQKINRILQGGKQDEHI